MARCIVCLFCVVLAASAAGENIAIVSGNGQLVPEYNLTIRPLRVRVTNAIGQPVANAVVTWTLTSGSVTIQRPTSTTDEAGIAETGVVTSQVTFGYSFRPATITATTGSGTSVPFTLTTYLLTLPGGRLATQPVVQVLAPPPEINEIIAASGQILPGAIQARIIAAAGLQSGQLIPGVGVRLALPEGAGEAACTNDGGSPLSNSNGVVTCDLRIVGPPGNFIAALVVGEAIQFNVRVTLTAGSSMSFVIEQGNGQTGSPGVVQPMMLRAQLVNASSTPQTGVDVTWTVVSGTATLQNTITRTDTQGRVSTAVKLGTAGDSTIRVSAGTATADFTVHSVAVSGGASVVSGNQQTTGASQPFPLPLVVRVTDANNNLLSGVPVTFAVTGGSATLSSTTAMTNTSGQAQVTATAGNVAGTITITASAGAGSSATFTLNAVLASKLLFVPLTPCRIVDTRQGGGPFNPNQTLQAHESRSIPVAGRCNVPASAQAYSLNATVIPKGPLGYLSLWPSGEPQPLVSTLNSQDGGIVANAALVPAGTGGAVSVFVTDATDLVLDINGYFASAPATTSFAFYAVPPCRVADTRNAAGAFGGPSLSPGQTRSFAVPAGPCPVSAQAGAYSMNATVAPTSGLAFLTLWPSGSSQPVVSTLNSPAGRIVANAAIVPAGFNAGIDAFVTDRTDLVLDLNGYFAAAGSAGALSFYPVTPCRIVDTRLATGPFGGPVMEPGSARTFQMPAGGCGIPSGARAYSVNVTVVPLEPLGFLSLRPPDAPSAVVSTLNSLDGRIVANAALAPADAAGAISVYVTNRTHVILDINGYFAP